MRNKFLGTGRRGFRPLQKVRTALRGLRYAVLLDFAVSYKLVLTVLVLASCLYYRKWLDLSVVLLATALMVVAELFNTTIEALCDFVRPEADRRIRIVKDIAAAAVGVSILVWAGIVLGQGVRVWEELNGEGRTTPEARVAPGADPGADDQLEVSRVTTCVASNSCPSSIS